MTVLITKALLVASKTKKGGYSKKQIELAKSLPDNGIKPMSKLVGRIVEDEWWEKFNRLQTRREALIERKENRRLAQIERSKPINAMSPNIGSWDWKPLPTDVPRLKVVSSKKGKNQGRKQEKRDAIARTPDSEFYISKEWRALRVRVLEKYDCMCMMCGRSPKIHKVVIHVDHIKPRSKHPELCLSFDNLQLLCEDCNLGKSNKYETDYRPDDIRIFHNSKTTANDGNL
jgi:5-methylcytosine-specific restriction endonuclease McrA